MINKQVEHIQHVLLEAKEKLQDPCFWENTTSFSEEAKKRIRLFVTQKINY